MKNFEDKVKEIEGKTDLDEIIIIEIGMEFYDIGFKKGALKTTELIAEKLEEKDHA